uniref:ARB2 cotranscriptional regulator A n=1 Tax=Leptobrachium leishanense TaxID=445787 RepID=A0A8C5LXI3_9ANUR
MVRVCNLCPCLTLPSVLLQCPFLSSLVALYPAFSFLDYRPPSSNCAGKWRPRVIGRRRAVRVIGCCRPAFTSSDAAGPHSRHRMPSAVKDSAGGPRAATAGSEGPGHLLVFLFLRLARPCLLSLFGGAHNPRFEAHTISAGNLRRLMSILLFTFVWLFVWINMAQLQQVGGPEEKEKTAVLKDLLSRIDLDELMKKEEPPLEFPDTLEGFEYTFNKQGQLRHVKTGDPFVFNYREDLHRWNQKRYEALGEIITKHVYELLEKECKLEKVYLPIDATESEPKSFIFMSKDALTNPEKLLVLVHGSGVVRAGQWARRLIINEDLDSGTQIPFINRAMKENYAVIVLNPNENYIEVEKSKTPVQQPSPDSSDEPAEKRERKERIPKDTKKRKDYEKYRNPQKEKETLQLYIKENGSPEEHALYVWDNFISKAEAENVFFVAHSYGGLAFVELIIQREADVKSKVAAVALTDSVHNVWHQDANKAIREWMRENCCNWVSSSEPLDTTVESMLPDCPRVSAVKDVFWNRRQSTDCMELYPQITQKICLCFVVLKAKPCVIC